MAPRQDRRWPRSLLMQRSHRCLTDKSHASSAFATSLRPAADMFAESIRVPSAAMISGRYRQGEGVDAPSLLTILVN